MSSPNVGPISIGPVPPYTNVQINAQYYIPSRFVISNITLGMTTIVTTTANTNYSIGQVVRLIIPTSWGCGKLNGAEGLVLSFPMPNQVELNINSSQNVDAFNSASILTTQPQILAIGDINSGNINTTGRINLNNTIPGSFTNISPL